MKKILIVEDAQSDQKSLEAIIKSAGHDVILCSNGLEAIEQAKSTQPDLIFMDVNMPQMDGFQATREILALPECINAKIVFVTAKNQRADQVWAKMLGAKGFISKPYSAEQILEEMKKHIGV